MESALRRARNADQTIWRRMACRCCHRPVCEATGTCRVSHQRTVGRSVIAPVGGREKHEILRTSFWSSLWTGDLPDSGSSELNAHHTCAHRNHPPNHFLMRKPLPSGTPASVERDPNSPLPLFQHARRPPPPQGAVGNPWNRCHRDLITATPGDCIGVRSCSRRALIAVLAKMFAPCD